ncbi:hypothetical protein Q5752_003243 [Cryptotrichosporon argae]
MGNCLSDPSPEGGEKLGSASRSSAAPGGAARTAATGPGRTLGGAPADSAAVGAEDPRQAALRAAEERARAAQNKGVSTSNPKAGALSAKLAAERRGPPPPQANDRMMDAGQWN